jgi:cytoskeletal protein CcmA (bactofilin family)
MKNPIILEKSKRWLVILCFTFFSSFNLVAQTTITSTTSGGSWNATATWTGGVVPTSSNHVVINGTVTLNGDFTCNNLTINSAGSIMNQWGWSPTFTVNGKFTNNGTVTKLPEGYALYLKILGDIENNGTWTPDQTYLSGNSDQNIKQASGKSFQGYFQTTDNIGQIVLGSDVTFSSNRWDWNKSQLRTNGFNLTTLDYQLNNGIINSNENLILRNTGIAAMTFDGNYKIDGKVRIQGDNVFNGTVTVLDTMHNDWGYSPTLTVNAKIINNGTIISHPSGYAIYLNILNDIENNGKWAPNQTSFSGTSDQNIRQSAGKSFQGYFLTTDALGQIVLGSDVTFENNKWDWTKSKLLTNGFKLTTLNYQLNNGTIISNDNLILRNTGIAAMTFEGNYKIDGRVRIQGDNVFNGTVTVLDTLHNDWGYSPSLTVNAKIINNGTIITNPAGYALYLNVLNDIENKGKWAPDQTTFSGTSDQNIKQAAGKSFQGYFLTTDTLGQIVLGSDVTFENNKWDWTKSKLLTNGFNFTTLNYQLNNGTIISNDNLVLRNTGIAAMTFNGNYKIDGRVRIQGDNVFNGTVTVLDTLHNDWGYSPGLTVNAKIINNGTIITNPAGYALYLNVLNDIENYGKWAPTQTTFSGNNNQRLKQSTGKSFQGYMLTSDSIGEIILDSDVLFDGNTWDMSKCQVQTNKFKLLTLNNLLSGGKILSNDTLVLSNCRIARMTFNGDYKIDGKVRIQGENVFNGTVTVLDTLHNDWGYSPTAVCSGNLINNGTIINHPSGYSLNMQIKGNLTNHHIFSISSLYLTGTNSRTISGSNANGIQANIYVDDAIALIGDNKLPNINFTGNPAASCTIKSGASLNLNFLPNSSKIKNMGRLSVSLDVDNMNNNTYNFYASSVSTKAKTVVSKLTVDNYGYQQHPTATGTVNTWWRVRNTPQVFNDTLNWLKLSYQDDALNGIIEDSIKVFHSPNAGMSWKRIKSGYTVDKAGNVVTINNAPSFGHYLLSSSALGITSFEPLVETAEPRFGGNTGQLTMYLFGAGFKSTSLVKLKLTGQSEILADTTYLTEALGESMIAKFDLKNRALGVYDVIIETPGQKTLTLSAYFTVMAGERSNPWSTLSGRDRFLINRWQTFNIGYGNTANTDALGTILVYVVNDLPGLEVEFPDINVVLPKAVVDMGPNFTRFRDIGLYYTTETLTGYEGQKMRVYPFYIPYIPAGSANSTRVKIKLNGAGTLKMDSWLLDPLFEKIDYSLKSAQPMPDEVRACITAAAMHAFSNGALGLAEGMIPGVACWGVIDKTIDPIGLITPDSMKPEGETREDGKATWGSWLWSGVSIMASAVQCGASFVPGVGQAVGLGIGLVNLAVDMKDGYDANAGCWRKFNKKSQAKLNSRGVTSFDPNEKVGPRGFTSEHYISKEGNLNYTIFFENKKTAGASALEVFVKDTLDVTKFDFKTFSFSSVTFGETTTKIQEYAKEFQILVDLYPEKNIIVQVHGELDTIKGIISWEFHSLDRITMELTEDPDMGFLPPNVNGPEGEGNVTYSCKLKNTVAHNDLISNRASIVFDFNAPILTNLYTNRIDDRLPVSSVDPIHHVQYDSIFYVSWSGSDLGSEISKYNIFVSKNNQEYVLWKVASEPGVAEFRGKDGDIFKFYSLATDSVGFTETRKLSPEATTTMNVKVGLDQMDTNATVFQVFPNPAKQQCNVMFNFPSTTELSISLVDVSGRKIRTIDKQSYQQGQQTAVMNLSGIPNGLYLVKLHNNGKTFYQKLVIKN